MGEVDEAEDAEEQREADSDERVHASDRRGIDELLRPILQQHFRPFRLEISGWCAGHLNCDVALPSLLLDLHERGRGRVGSVEDLPFTALDFVDGDVNGAWHAILVEMEVADQSMELLRIELIEYVCARHSALLGSLLNCLHENFARGVRHRPESLVRIVELRLLVGLLEGSAWPVRVVLPRQ